MTRIVGYLCSDYSLTQSVIEALDGEFDHSEPEPGGSLGRGFGWVQEGRSLLRKQPPQARSRANLGAMLADIPSRQMVGFERSYDRGVVDPLDLQPFSYRTWVYVQSESVGAVAENQEALLGRIPDYIRRNIDGQTPEEVCFHLFLTGLQARGGFGLSESDPRACASALVEAAGEIEALSEGAQPPGAVVTASQRLLLAVATDGPLWIRRFEGIEEQREEPLFAGHRPQTEQHPHFRAVLLSNAVEGPAEAWERIPDRHAAWIGWDWELSTEAMEAFET